MELECCLSWVTRHSLLLSPSEPLYLCSQLPYGADFFWTKCLSLPLRTDSEMHRGGRKGWAWKTVKGLSLLRGEWKEGSEHKIREQNIEREEWEEIILFEECLVKDIRRKEEKRLAGEMSMSQSQIFKPAIKSADVHQSGHLSSSHPQPSASGCWETWFAFR